MTADRGGRALLDGGGEGGESRARRLRRRAVIGAAGLVTLMWVLAPLTSGRDSTSPPPTGGGSWLPPGPSPSGEEAPGGASPAAPGPAGETGPAGPASEAPPRRVESEEEPVDQPSWSAVPAETPPETLEAIAAAVGARLRAELTGEGRAAYPETVWRRPPCCSWVKLTGLTADLTTGAAVRVVVEWETDQGRGSGPTYWSVDGEGRWSPAAAEAPG